MKKILKWLGVLIITILVAVIYSGTYLDISREDLEAKYATGPSKFLDLFPAPVTIATRCSSLWPTLLFLPIHQPRDKPVHFIHRKLAFFMNASPNHRV